MTWMFMRSLRHVASAAALGTMLVAGAPAIATAQPIGEPDFTSIIEKVDPGVVNIRTTASIRVAGRGPGGGSDPYELFRWFFGPDFAPPGVPPRGAPGPEPEG